MVAFLVWVQKVLGSIPSFPLFGTLSLNPILSNGLGYSAFTRKVRVRFPVWELLMTLVSHPCLHSSVVEQQPCINTICHTLYVSCRSPVQSRLEAFFINSLLEFLLKILRGKPHLTSLAQLVVASDF